MISISRLMLGTVSPGDHLRYGRAHSGDNGGVPRPVVVWNSTRACNLKCVHCYASATEKPAANEMTTVEARSFIQDIAAFGAPVILFSGGEPLLRPDFLELAEHAASQGLRVALSTNGTLIDGAMASNLKRIGFTEVGISLDGIGEKNDRFRGQPGAFDKALNGVRHSMANGLRVSLRLTMTRFNYKELPAIFRLVEDEGIERVCIYHLAYSGRGEKLKAADLSPEETRQAVDGIIDITRDLHRRGKPKEILTVGNHADGVYLYLKTLQENPERAGKVLELLKLNGGNNSGSRIGAVDEAGNVHPDQFWRHYSLGNVKERSFGQIWADTSEPLLGSLRNRKELLKGRCRQCAYLELCNGNLRVRAESFYGDVWAPDPACYLTDTEIGAGGE
ncbi:radical SAM additional 4Fe4S-binding SPASM domain-containing protein [Dehalogenimonas formicexedens]|uniref:Mycofactocin maturase MftC n=1 Tax=Dehalogenimonas formicexedens TaxID=1839801 RepID=A0A1P8F9G9_9CHLR|nr:radical SAM protein [Dehalogenimonas formicexedens]APV45109.1 radical SAM additional 4Fe4S-binding SPASM domain-containing protein [Dehalogenimonas formicexedens]